MKNKGFQPTGVILSGGPASVHDENAPQIPPAVLELKCPILGICYGQQILCQTLGGKVETHEHREFGRAYIMVDRECSLSHGVWATGAVEQVWMSHGDRVTALPPVLRPLPIRRVHLMPLSLMKSGKFMASSSILKLYILPMERH